MTLADGDRQNRVKAGTRRIRSIDLDRGDARNSRRTGDETSRNVYGCPHWQARRAVVGRAIASLNLKRERLTNCASNGKWDRDDGNAITVRRSNDSAIAKRFEIVRD